jgi:hypothetical protein
VAMNQRSPSPPGCARGIARESGGPVVVLPDDGLAGYAVTSNEFNAPIDSVEGPTGARIPTLTSRSTTKYCFISRLLMHHGCRLWRSAGHLIGRMAYGAACSACCYDEYEIVRSSGTGEAVGTVPAVVTVTVTVTGSSI